MLYRFLLVSGPNFFLFISATNPLKKIAANHRIDQSIAKYQSTKITASSRALRSSRIDVGGGAEYNRDGDADKENRLYPYTNRIAIEIWEEA